MRVGCVPAGTGEWPGEFPFQEKLESTAADRGPCQGPTTTPTAFGCHFMSIFFPQHGERQREKCFGGETVGRGSELCSPNPMEGILPQSPPHCPQGLIVMEPSPQSPSTLQSHCCPVSISRDSHQMLRVRRRVMLQKPVPLTPSLGRVDVRAGVFFSFKHAILFLL